MAAAGLLCHLCDVSISYSKMLVCLPAFVCPPLTGNTDSSPLEIHPSSSGRARWICTVRRSCSYPDGNHTKKNSQQKLK